MLIVKISGDSVILPAKSDDVFATSCSMRVSGDCSKSLSSNRLTLIHCVVETTLTDEITSVNSVGNE